MSTCLNLLARFGDSYRVTFDPAYSPRNVPREKLDPWAMQLSCRFGTVYPHGGDLLAVEVDYHPKAAKALAAIPGLVLYLDGDGERTFVFHVHLFEQVDAIVKPKRRRRLSEEQRRECRERLAKVRPKKPT